MSVPAVFVVSSLTASVSEYGEDVRETGMTVCGRIVAAPADSRVSTRLPSSDPVRMWAVVSEPSSTVLFMAEGDECLTALQGNILHRADFHAR